MSWLEKPGALAALQTTRTNVDIAKEFGTSEKSVRRAKKSQGITALAPQAASGETSEDSNGAKSVTAVRTRPITLQDARDWITATGDNPDDYTLSIRSIAYGEGLFSNRMSAVPKRNLTPALEPLVSDDDVEASRKRIRKWKLPARIPGTGLGAPVAVALNLADIQLYKPEGGGVEATEQRLYDGLENFQKYVNRQRASGRNIDEIAIINNGDPFEGIAGNYANQTHVVKAGLRKQMNGVLDIWEAYSRELYPQFNKGKFITVHCNHTQFGRQGGAAKSITGDEDTGSAFLAETLQRTLRGRADFDHVEFTIPDDEMNVYATLAGVPVGFNHGHKIPGTDAGGFEKWLNGQVRGDRQAYEARIWITAHKHHFAAWDMGSCTVFQCPSCDGGSKWLRDSTGRFSRSGILALLIGEHDPLGWSDQAFL